MKRMSAVDIVAMEAYGDKKIDGMPVKVIKAMLKSSKTPKRLKMAWKKKLGKVI
jgi:hypothetical protein